MNKYFEAIEKAKVARGLFESFGYSDKKDTLEKSHVEDIFERDAPSRGFTIDKNGKEIKERLQKMLADEQQTCTMLQVTWTEMLSKFEDKPTQPAIKELYYMVDGWEDKLGDLPLMFPWDKTYCNAESPSIDGYMESTPSAEAELCKQRREYNDIVQRYIGCKKEIALLQTMIDNFSDEKIYKLTVKEAAMLGW